MADTRTPDEIERDIERERAQLGNTVDELQNRFSPEQILRDIGRGLSDHGSDIGTAVTQSVKRNPVALALTGIGLAWLMSGKSWDETKDGVARGARAVGDRVPNPLGGSNDEHTGSARSARTQAGVRGGAYRDDGDLTRKFGSDHPVEDDWLWAEDDDLWDDHDDGFDSADDGPGFGEKVSGSLSAAGDSVGDAAGRVGSGAKAAASKVGAGASGAASGIAQGAASVADSARSGAGAVRDSVAAAGHSTAERARRIRQRLARGTEALGEEARERVIAARWAAVKAQRKVTRRAKAGADAVSDFYGENPLVVGGLAIAAGAILAGALPRTRQEDEAFGAYSDKTYDRAERIFHEERRKATRVAERAADTAKEVLDEERGKLDSQAPGDKSAVEQVADEIRDGASRVADATKDEARKQNLGKPKT